MSQAYDSSLAHVVIRSLGLWAGFDYQRILSLIGRYQSVRRAARLRRFLAQSEGLSVPPILIYSATMACNLRCTGCYSRDYSLTGELSLEQADRLFGEAAALGVSFMVITGGEPLLRKGLLELLVKHPKIVFLLFNNGTGVDDAAARVIGGSINIIPMLSIEGAERMTDSRRGAGAHARVLGAMELLRAYRSFFGFSVMVTRENAELLCTDTFYEALIGRGCRIGLLVAYVPSSKNASLAMVPSESQRERLRAAVIMHKKKKRLLLMQMPEDEYVRDGRCMAAGRGFAHITAQGELEPCPFARVADRSLKVSTLREALASPLFAAIRARPELFTQPSMGCALFEHRDELCALCKELGGRQTVDALSGAL